MPPLRSYSTEGNPSPSCSARSATVGFQSVRRELGEHQLVARALVGDEQVSLAGRRGAAGDGAAVDDSHGVAGDREGTGAGGADDSGTDDDHIVGHVALPFRPPLGFISLSNILHTIES